MFKSVLALGCVAVCGCAHPAVTGPVERPYPPPSVETLLQGLRARGGSVRSLRTDARVDYAEAGDARVKLKMSFLVEAPDHLRIEAAGPVGGPVASLASDGKTFQMLDVRNNRFLQGEASPCNLARLLRVALRPADVVMLLTAGLPAPPEGAGAPEISWDSSAGGREVLRLSASDGSETYKLAPRTFDPVEIIRKDALGRPTLRIVGDGFSDDSGARLPAQLSIEQPQKKADARLRFRDRELNPTPPPGAFHLDPPPGIPVENVSCEGG